MQFLPISHTEGDMAFLNASLAPAPSIVSHFSTLYVEKCPIRPKRILTLKSRLGHMTHRAYLTLHRPSSPTIVNKRLEISYVRNIDVRWCRCTTQEPVLSPVSWHSYYTLFTNDVDLLIVYKMMDKIAIFARKRLPKRLAKMYRRLC